LVEEIKAISAAVCKRRLSPPVQSRIFEVTGPYEMRERREMISEIPERCVLLRVILTGICRADLRYVSCSRPPHILRERLPLPVFHEGIARVVETGDEVRGFRRGDLVVVVPNIPCYIHDPEKYPDVYRACDSCKPGGPGENLCRDVRFLSSSAPGLSRTFLLHPASCIFRIPGGVPEEIAVLTEPLTVVKRAIELAGVSHGSRVAILGGGFMGFITAAVLSFIFGIPKRDILVTDIFDFKLEKFQDFALTVNVGEKPIPNDHLSSFDAAFECAGGKAAESTIEQALSLLSPGGTCMLIGVSEDRVPVRTRVILEKGLRLMGTTRSAAIDYITVLKWLRRGEFTEALRRIIYHRVFKAESCSSILSACRTAESPETHGKILIDWRLEGNGD
jgi:ribitol-5-phosphate 2-dehydrogenase